MFEEATDVDDISLDADPATAAPPAPALPLIVLPINVQQTPSPSKAAEGADILAVKATPPQIAAAPSEAGVPAAALAQQTASEPEAPAIQQQGERPRQASGDAATAAEASGSSIYREAPAPEAPQPAAGPRPPPDVAQPAPIPGSPAPVKAAATAAQIAAPASTANPPVQAPADPEVLAPANAPAPVQAKAAPARADAAPPPIATAPAGSQPLPQVAPASPPTVQAHLQTSAAPAPQTLPDAPVSPPAVATEARPPLRAAKTTAMPVAAQVEAPDTEQAPDGSTLARTKPSASTLATPAALAPQAAGVAVEDVLDETAAEPPPERRASETAPPRAEATAAPAAATSAPVRGSPETVAHLAAEIVKKLEGKATRFDIELAPVGLGKVEVRLEIGAHGQVAAAMSFESPQAAADVRARAADLQRQLEQAGFTLSGAMSFDVAGERGQSQQQAEQQPSANAAHRGRAFQAALDALEAPAPSPVLRRWSAQGLDIRI